MIKFPIAALMAVVTLLGGFYGGYRTGQNTQPSNAAFAGSGTGAGTRTGQGQFRLACTAPSPGASPSVAQRALRRGATGTVTTMANGSLTLHDPRCNTDVTVTYSPTVIIRKTVDGQVSDLQENEAVVVQGVRQADGSLKANSITIVPAGQAGFGGLGGGAAIGG